MTSPVMQALLNVRVEEEPSAFGKWCLQRNVRALPAPPIHVAAFIRDCEPFASIEAIWGAVREMSQLHLSNGFADPTAGGVVAEAMNSIANIEPPRSWPKALKERFLQLPYDVQAFLERCERQRDKVVRLAQNEAAAARRVLSELRSKEAA